MKKKPCSEQYNVNNLNNQLKVLQLHVIIKIFNVKIIQKK